MLWQDWVFTFGQVVFIIALIPSLRGKSKPAFLTSLITGMVLVLFAITFYSLSLWFSTVATIITSLAWFFLAFQKHRQTK